MYHSQPDHEHHIDHEMLGRVGKTVIVLVTVMFGLIYLANLIA